MTALLETLGLRKTFGSIVALDGVSLAIAEGSIVGLLGPNGAGKTTLMKIVVGLVRPDSGEVRVGRGAVEIGALIERPGFYPYLSGRRNLEALGLTAGIGRDTLAAEVTSILDRLDLAKAADRRFGEFSTGMKQRLGLGAALLGRPEVLILDEPVSGLDPAGVASIRRLMLELRAEGRTVLVSSHILGEVEQVCDQIAIIDNGRLIAVGPLDQLTAGPPTWRLIFSAVDLAEKAAAVLSRDFVATVHSAEIRAVARDGIEVAPLEVVVRAGLVPREASLQQTSLEEAYLRLIGTQQSGDAE